jgi:diguanylate cyclase (GGDEF)-like protein
MTDTKGRRRRRAISLRSVLSGLCGAAGIVVGLLSTFALHDTIDLSDDLEALGDKAHVLLHTELTTAAIWRRFAQEIAALDASGAAEVEDEALTLALAEAKPWLSRDHWTLLDELRESSVRAGQRARALAMRGGEREARRALVDELRTLSRARVEPLLGAERSAGSRHFQDLAARTERVTQHPILRAGGGRELSETALPALYESLVAARLIESLRAEEWRAMAGESPQPGVSESFSAELDRVHPNRAFQATLASSVADLGREAFVAEVGTVITKTWPRVTEILSGLSRAANWQIALLGGISLLGGLACVGISVLMSRTLFSPLEYLSARLRLARTDAHAPSLELGELGSRWSELEEIEHAFVQTTSELEASHREMHALAFYDAVTGLANRRFFTERLEGALVSSRVENSTVALISVGLESIRQAGDTLGEAASQTVLREAAERLCEIVRLTDFIGTSLPSRGSTASVSRSGDADFSVLLSNVDSGESAARVAERAIVELQQPFLADDRELRVEAHLGIAVFPDDARTGADLIRASRAALEHAQSRGSANPYQFFSRDMNDRAARSFHLRSRLSGALERGDLRLHYQPFRAIRTGNVSGAEVLLRWSDAEMGPVPPTEFIPQAEQGGLIHSIGKWVLEQALEQQQEWIQRGFEPVRMAVNVSAAQLSEPGWADSVKDALEMTGADPTRLELEITETAFLQDSSAALTAFQELDEMGVGIVLDDFGTGYSQLSYLHHYPIQRIKIDRSFIATIDDAPTGAAITQAILGMAHSLGLQIIAEGVETEEQAAFLTRHGCDEIQGYLVSHGVPATEFERFLVRRKEEDASEDEDASDD